MTDRKELARRALAEKTVLKLLQEAHNQTRAELAEHFTDPGEREVGMLLDHRLGTVSLEAGSEYWTVTDEDALIEWAAAWAPTWVKSAPQLEPGIRDMVLAECKRLGGLLDETTGEVVVPDGVTYRQGAPTLVERTDKHAGFVVREFLGIEATEKLGIEA